jgi:hypothetical protein
MNEIKHANFRRLAKPRGERVLKDLRLLGNLANKRNYDYTDTEVRALFSVIEEELKLAKLGFDKNKKRGINL